VHQTRTTAKGQDSVRQDKLQHDGSKQYGVKAPAGAFAQSAVFRAFRILAVAEAFSWAALLTGMYFKWVAGTTELGVQVAGPIHGALFIGYGIVALALWRLQRWPFLVAVLAGVSAVFPFATLWFERWAGKRGYLSGATPRPAGAAEAAEPVAAGDVRGA
jgi:integral membrane protein